MGSTPKPAKPVELIGKEPGKGSVYEKFPRGDMKGKGFLLN